jgi:hypothetical protein
MALTYAAGSQAPTAANLTTLSAQTIGNSTPNELEIALLYCQQKATWTGLAPGAQPNFTTIQTS